MKHYPYLIHQFGAPNGLCSSITESKHIKVVKQPYQCTNCFQALGQILLINQRLDKLTAAQADFKAHGMLNGTCLSHVFEALGMKISLHDLFDFNCSLGLVHPNKTRDGTEANLDA